MNANKRAKILSIPGMRAVCDTIVNFESKLLLSKLENQRNRLDKLIDSVNNPRCFIVGNGPSLTSSDLDLLVNEDCFASNHIYKMFNKTAWRPKYYVIQDRYTKLEIPISDLGASAIFVGAYYLANNSIELPSNSFVFYGKRDIIRSREYIPFSNNITEKVYVGYTVTYSMIQIAAALGYKEIYLLGIDHVYSTETNDKGIVIRTNRVKNHAYDDVNNEVMANVIGMEKAYRSALNQSINSGKFCIYNVTRGGKLEVFERRQLENVVN